MTTDSDFLRQVRIFSARLIIPAAWMLELIKF